MMLLIVCVPEVVLPPVQLPDAVQLVAFVLDQVNVVKPPLTTVSGLALNVAVGVAGGAAATVIVTDCEALPLTLVHVSV